MSPLRTLAGTAIVAVLGTLGYVSAAQAACTLNPAEVLRQAAEGGIPVAAASNSMFPGLPDGAKGFAKKLGTDTPVHRGDVVALCTLKDAQTLYLKRIVGVAGDFVMMQNDDLWVNGAPVAKLADGTAQLESQTLDCFIEWIDGPKYRVCQSNPPGPLATTQEWVVPQGEVFALGDNRDASVDSRLPDFGFVPVENIVGRLVLSVMQLMGTPPATSSGTGRPPVPGRP